METIKEVANLCPNTLNGTTGAVFLTLINTLITAQCSLRPEGRYPPDYGPQLRDGEEFDFIIVGAGSGGSIVANRLSGVKEWKVLLLEAGGYPSATTEIPSLGFSLLNTNEDWQYKTEESSTCCLGLRNKVCSCPRGKGLGGTSLLNAMLYFRSNQKDHDTWPSKGIVGWDYDSCLEQYMKIEDALIDNDYRFGIGGDIKIIQTQSNEPLRNTLVEAYKELGVIEYKDEEPLGYKDGPMTISEGRRYSAAKAFLTPIKDRTNLYVALNAHVAKILIDANTTTIQGVQVKINERVLTIKASKEVIVSAGAINSPQILMHSGIGPKEHLQALGITVIKDLRVGNNYQDHAMFPGLMYDIDESALTTIKEPDDLYNYFMYRKGRLSNIGLGNFVAFLATEEGSEYPNLQVLHTPIHQNDNFVIPHVFSAYGIPEKITESVVGHNKNSHNLILQPVLLNPKSKGQIRLRNNDPFAPPLIIPNLFTDEKDEDIQEMLAGIRILQRLTKTESFRRVNVKPIDLDIENCKGLVSDSDAFWKCAVRNLASTAFHPAGTCKMGPENDPEAVVDPTLKVHGVKGVRVIDASIMPSIISCNLNAAIFMIGERGAGLIKKEWM